MRITGLLKHEIDTLVVSLENEKKEGINETTKELVKKMLAEKIDVPIIMRIAELSRTDVERSSKQSNRVSREGYHLQGEPILGKIIPADTSQ